ncbi:FkbM family methyltransferase [Panacagrimonas sp.]|uniref:FkbM family methyltransferase n=1 Tax=Panacagrimonas sp. TaxID=2480088 RepID=UPI003B52E73E
MHPTTPLQSAAALPRDPFLTDLRRANAAFQVRCIFDVGANIGQSTDRFRRACPEAIIHAFEPIGQSYAALYSRFATDNFVRCENLALGAKAAGTGLMRASGTSTDNHLLNEAPRPGLPVEMVQMTSGEAYCERHGIEQIDFLKIDAEGHDMEVLRGFLKLLRQHRIAFVQVEASMNPGNQRHVPFSQFTQLLEPMGYYLFGLYDQVREIRKGQPALRRSNPVFVSQRLTPWPKPEPRRR